MEEMMKDRIRAVMENQHQTQKIFASFIGVGEGTLSNIFNGRTNPTLNIVEAIKNKIPSVSTDWLLFGKGTMYEAPVSAAPTPSGDGHDDAREPMIDFDGVPDEPTQPLSGAGRMHGVAETPKNAAKTVVKYVDKPQRSITEIRVFYDDQTWETFVPKH